MNNHNLHITNYGKEKMARPRPSTPPPPLAHLPPPPPQHLRLDHLLVEYADRLIAHTYTYYNLGFFQRIQRKIGESRGISQFPSTLWRYENVLFPDT